MRPRLSPVGREAGVAGDQSSGLLVPAEESASSGGSIPSGPSSVRCHFLPTAARVTAKKPSC